MYIKTDRLVKRYGKKIAVNHVSIEVKQGEVVGLLGPNGAGKTTTFYMVTGLVKPNEGDVYLGDHEITRLPMHKRSHLGIGYLPQEASIFRKLTVEENILILWELMPEIPKKEYESRLVGLLAELGVTHLRKQKAYSLSGGEQRRVEIARALSTSPAFLLLDEPFTGIDPKTVGDLQGIIRHLKEKGIGVLITDHNVRETLAITDRAYIIHKGEILVAGNSKEIAESAEAKKFYLGDEFEL
ncbi:LPS export ABC transporter ATP-binding protein [candidate division WOR-1 bacterium RIFCSPHIGHO2_01_FULL_53_15]|uniref:LPS export ABC transporter ATP-binding protein n=1 Tax=candidate division WOR-1 bacterium RIFCSPHIGHO2_01_FULL_53_15 TaxID=1802564 RepID=A0A1F4PZ22_UNCSA|nr:MAG: LPS export ABC transporter ATP-binding protein [candidate division WOR-1 bacterium RIFCSPHIGHO2_01_FULL_53_15]OGC10466.1 MAG: LPS export ABC transporter ATP-binding protein [candidate division WOR-1 bacterium RIFCSPHIGHO2_02_FULL_53_26]